MKIEILCDNVPFFRTDSIAEALVFSHALDRFIHGCPLLIYYNGVQFTKDDIERIMKNESCRYEKVSVHEQKNR